MCYVVWASQDRRLHSQSLPPPPPHQSTSLRSRLEGADFTRWLTHPYAAVNDCRTKAPLHWLPNKSPWVPSQYATCSNQWESPTSFENFLDKIMQRLLNTIILFGITFLETCVAVRSTRCWGLSTGCCGSIQDLGPSAGWKLPVPRSWSKTEAVQLRSPTTRTASATTLVSTANESLKCVLLTCTSTWYIIYYTSIVG